MAGSLHWDVARFWLEIRARAGSSSRMLRLDGIAVDTWGVDYALLGEDGQLLENPYHYRDRRTDGMMEQVFRRCPAEEIYRDNRHSVHADQYAVSIVCGGTAETPRLLAAAERC